MAKKAELVNPTWADTAHIKLYDAETVAEMMQLTIKAIKAHASDEDYQHFGRLLLKDFDKINRNNPDDRTNKVRARCLRTIWECDDGG